MSDAAFALTTFAGVFVSVDQRFCDIIQREQSDILGRTILELTAGEDHAANGAKLDVLRATGEPFTIDKHYLSSSGSIVPVRNEVSLLQNGESAPSLVARITRVHKTTQPSQRDLLGIASAIAGERQLRAAKIDPFWSEGLAWQIVLAAYISEATGSASLVEEILGQLAAPVEEGKRMLKALVCRGVLTLDCSKCDNERRLAVALSLATMQAVEEYLTSLCG